MSSLRMAISVLRAGGIIAHRSDTVLGLACLPHAASLARLSRIKMRPQNKPFLLLADSLTQLSDFIAEDLTLESTLTAHATPTTCLIQASATCPTALIGPSQQVAVRLSQHPNIIALSQAVGALASTSANLSGQDTALNFVELRKQFGLELDYLYDSGNSGSGKSSRIVDLKTQQILRA